LPAVTCLTFFNLSDNKTFFLIDLAKVHALDRARIDHRRVRSEIEVLVAVDVPERYVIQRRICHQTGRQDDIPTDFDSLLAAKLSPCDGSVCSQNGRETGIKIGDCLIEPAS